MHSEERLLPSNSPKVSALALRKLNRFPNFKILFGQKVDVQEVRAYCLSGTFYMLDCMVARVMWVAARVMYLQSIQYLRQYAFLGQHEYTTSRGEKIFADVALLTAGNLTPNSGMFQRELGQVISNTGFIKVAPTFQVQGLDNIFALGDVADSGVCIYEYRVPRTRVLF